MYFGTARGASPGFIEALNTSWHKRALAGFMVIVVAHLAEHVAQAIQIYVLHWHVREARGLLGLPFPWLIHSEWLHFMYALVTLVGVILLQPGFTGPARTWWNVALGIQSWHFFEHLLLLAQAATGAHLLGRNAPTSVVQLVAPRVELHLFYNAVVFAPMMVAVVMHRWPWPERQASRRAAPGRV